LPRFVSRTVLAATAGLLLLAPSAFGATYVANKHGDPLPNGCTASHCTIREAVIKANAHPGADTIILEGGTEYQLSRVVTADDPNDGDLDIQAADNAAGLTIKSSNTSLAIVDGGGIDHVFETVTPATFRYLKIRHGHAHLTEEDGGGAINMLMDQQSFRAKVVHSTLTHNIADDDGGAVNAGDGNLIVKRSKVTGNRSNGSGGGLKIDDIGYINRSTIANNNAGIGNGGGIMLEGAPVTINNSTISGNRNTNDGGGLFIEGGTTTMKNDTVTENRSASGGGGIAGADVGTASLNALTIARNSADGGGGLFQAALMVFKVRGTIIARNSAISGGPDCRDLDTDFVSLGHNLIGKTSLCNGFGGNGDILNVTKSQAGLGSFGNHGGPTSTIALLEGSRAINNGSNQEPSKDQRGVRRSDPDIGAYERVASDDDD
jgi:hypothetical protein